MHTRAQGEESSSMAATDRPRGEKLQEGADKAGQHAQTAFHTLQERSPSGRQILGLLTLLALGTTGLVVGGLTIGGTILTLLALTPVFLFFSPVLVPLLTIAAFTIGGLLFAAASAVAAISGLSWLYNYFKGRQPPGSDQVEAARHRIQETAAHMKDRAPSGEAWTTGEEPPESPGSKRFEDYRRSKSARSPEGRRGSFRKVMQALKHSFEIQY